MRRSTVSVFHTFQIAAKIGGDAGPPLNNSNNAASDAFPFAAQKRQLEDHYWERAMSTTFGFAVSLSLVIGRGGEQISKIQQDSGCKVQIAPGNVCILYNAFAKMLLDEIVSRGQGTPPSSYHESTNGQNGTVHEIMIPAGKAGLVIGKGGETIKQLQERAGVKMILIQDASQGPNVDKPLRIIGDPYKVQQAQEMVQEILRERGHGGFSERNDFGSHMGGGGGMDIPVPRHSVGVVIGRSGEMIKKIQNDAGVRIQFKQDDGTSPDKIAHISGPPERCEHAAQIISDLLQSIRVRDEGQGVGNCNRGRGGGQGSWGTPGGEMTFSIPAVKCGLVIGRGGENVKSINQQTGAFVEISRQPPPNGDPNFKLFIIRGSPQQIDHAKQLIEEKIEAEANDPSAAWAAYYAQYYQQPPGAVPAQYPTNPAGGAQTPGDQSQATQTPGSQPDYSKAWEEYYKKMAGAASTTGGQLDYSAAWAQYYRQQAAYYGQTGQATGPPVTPQQRQVGTESGCWINGLKT
uniref:K Homology domain-containing protein n=1 Tax=Mola mola TaxID=94237 RepID=A0A3Q3VUQ5_MOLML